MLMRHAHEYEAKPRGGLAKRIVAVFASVAMLGGMGYATTSAALAEDDQTSSGDTSTLQPANSKSIAKIGGGDGDWYALHLTASGDSSSSTVTTAVPADIVLVLDKSDSMNKENRDRNAKNAANELAGKLLTDANATLPLEQQVQMAVVTFSDRAQIASQFTISSGDIGAAVNARPDGGTNWEDALKTANNLSSGRSGAQKYIVFLSDGDPTFRNTSYSGCFQRQGLGGWTQRPEYKTQADCLANNNWNDWWPSYQWKTDPDDMYGNIHGNGNNDDYGYNYAAALAAANGRGNAALYVVKASSDAKKMSDLAKDANAVTRKEYDGTSAKNLTKAFEQIYNTITTTAKIRAYSITDTLSQWVDPVDFADVANGTNITQYVTATNNGATVSGYTAVYNVDDNGNRTITVTFNNGNGMIVDKNETIDVSFKVKPSDAAYADYATNNQRYPDMGEADTGVESAGKQGYFSNAKAHLNYCVVTSVNDQESECTKPQTLNYAKPVVQVKLGQITINKTWSDDVNKHAGDTVKVQLQRTKTDDATAQTEKVGEITLNTSNNWTDTVGNLQPGYTYSVAETSEDSRYVVSYQYGNAAADATGVALTKAMVWQSDGNGGNMTATLTNTLKTTTLSNAITVRKNLEGRNWKAGDSFDFELTADGNAPLPLPCTQQPCKVTVAYKADSSDSKHSATFGAITYDAGKADYKYTITESKGNIAALHYSGAKYQIVVTVDEKDGIWTASVKSVTKLADDNDKNVSEPQETGGPIAFTNTYVAVSALPLTGGTTDRQWLLVGGSIGGFAVLLVGAAGIWNRKKRLV